MFIMHNQHMQFCPPDFGPGVLSITVNGDLSSAGNSLTFNLTQEKVKCNYLVYGYSSDLLSLFSFDVCVCFLFPILTLGFDCSHTVRVGFRR